eukprot:TRINITY_DN2845_c0_g1_i1.p1 TRINITY_DN2845_c0_g1~~TRINITY_DN2845_c0_g1_i1.p1  ORF type:complete len:322 (-),score=15.75 TRINITY_DN2845_c0_g1_i1:2178-3143(-)
MSVAVFYLLQLHLATAAILKGCGQRSEFDEQQLDNLQTSEIWSQISTRSACCPSKPVGGYFFHVPKCSGTSVRRVLDRYMYKNGFTVCDHNYNKKIAGPGYYNCGTSITDKQLYLDQIFRGRFLKDCFVISSHNDVTLLDIMDTHDINDNKQLVDIIVLREPTLRHLSEMKFIKVQVQQMDVSVLQEPFYKQKFIRWLHVTSNTFTKRLSGFFSCYDFSRAKQDGSVQEIHLKKAIINLSQFCVVIILEDPECGLMRLTQIFGDRNITFPRLNSGIQYQFDNEYLQQANVSNLFDQRLYKYALELNKLQCKQSQWNMRLFQ